MERFDRRAEQSQPATRRRRAVPLRVRRRAGSGPAFAVIGLLLALGVVLLFNQPQRGDPPRVRRELRKF